MKPLKYFFLTFFSISIICFSSVTASSLGDSNCSEYEFIFARGSGQTLNDVDFKNFKKEIDEQLSEKYLRYEFYELGTANNGYPAYSPDGLFSVLGTYVSAGESYEFGESVEKGTEELISHVRDEIKHCKDKRYILVGYSQGAFVINKALPYLNSSKIFYVATFGDPKLNLPEGKNGNGCKKIGLSSYRVYVPDCDVKEGVLGGQSPYETDDLKNKRGAWCNQNDFICGSNLNIFDMWKGHTTYTEENGYKKLANIISDKLSNREPSSPVTETRYSDYKKRDIVVLYNYDEQISTYGQEERKSIKDDLKTLLVSLAEHGSRIAIYNYYTASGPVRYIEEMVPFTNDNLPEKIDEFNIENSLKRGYVYKYTDNVYFAIKHVAKTADWSPGAERHIYLIRNKESSYRKSFDGTIMEDAKNAAKEENVKVFMFTKTNITSGPFMDLTVETGGEMIGTDYSKIILDKAETKKIAKYSSKTFDLTSEYTLIVINDAIYGITDKNRITINNIDEERENMITFISYNEEGKIDKKETHIVGQNKVTPPDSGKLNF